MRDSCPGLRGKSVGIGVFERVCRGRLRAVSALSVRDSQTRIASGIYCYLNLNGVGVVGCVGCTQPKDGFGAFPGCAKTGFPPTLKNKCTPRLCRCNSTIERRMGEGPTLDRLPFSPRTLSVYAKASRCVSRRREGEQSGHIAVSLMTERVGEGVGPCRGGKGWQKGRSAHLCTLRAVGGSCDSAGRLFEARHTRAESRAGGPPEARPRVAVAGRSGRSAYYILPLRRSILKRSCSGGSGAKLEVFICPS
jgi:hypothetical protein